MALCSSVAKSREQRNTDYPPELPNLTLSKVLAKAWNRRPGLHWRVGLASPTMLQPLTFNRRWINPRHLLWPGHGISDSSPARKVFGQQWQTGRTK